MRQPNRSARVLPALAALAALVWVAPAPAQSDYQARWIALADQHGAAQATDAGRDYEARFAAAHASIAADIEDACGRAGRRSGMANFQAVAVLAADGRVTDLLPMPRSPHFRCFEKEMVGQRYPAPPTAPWPQLLRFNLPTG